LIQVLGRIPRSANPDVLVGFETADDAGVYRLDDQRALVQTVDFFTPIVDDPYDYGAIAAANSVSDIYAMGGTPLTALAVVCCPDHPEMLEVLAEIMVGGADTLQKAGVSLLGGHSVCDSEIKFGYAVTGLVHPEKFIANAGAQAGDALVLTKPLGMGIITTAVKRSLADPETVREAIRIMTTLNRAASEVMLSFRCHAATDVTGYGLLGHGCEIAEASNASLCFHSKTVPFLPAAYPLAEARVFPGLVAKTWRLLEKKSFIHPSVPEPLRNILLDPQTSGGLLMAVHPDDRDAMLAEMSRKGIAAAHIGEVQPAGEFRILVD